MSRAGKFLLQFLLACVCLIFSHAALIVSHDLGWYPDQRLARFAMTSPELLQVDWFRWGLTLLVAASIFGLADYFLYRRYPRAILTTPTPSKPQSDDRIHPPTITQNLPNAPVGLLTKKWVLNYNPSNPRGRKNISFIADGTIGVGNNHNEYRWSYTNDHLDIWMKDNRLHNRFKYDPSTGKFLCTNDLDAPGVKHQVIYQGRA